MPNRTAESSFKGRWNVEERLLKKVYYRSDWQACEINEMAKILLVEDDGNLAKLVKDWLALDTHNVEAICDGQEAQSRLKADQYDLLILDINLPGLSGLEILKNFRQSGGNTPILMLTGKDSVADKEEGLNAGADDYLTKPFHGKELIARIKALLRRPAVLVTNVLKFDSLTLSRESYQVTNHGKEITLVPTEFDLLEFFMRNPNRVFAAEAILNRVWSSTSDATVEALTSCIKRLRKKIDHPGTPSLIRTIHGVGYKLQSAQQEDASADSIGARSEC